MTVRYRVIQYERTTDRVGGVIDVRPQFVVQVLRIAGMSNAAEPGETELTDAQAKALASLMQFRANPSRYIYHLETLAPDPVWA